MTNVLKSLLTFSFVAALALVTAGCPAEQAPAPAPAPAENKMDAPPAEAGETPMMAPETGSGTGGAAAVPQ